MQIYFVSVNVLFYVFLVVCGSMLVFASNCRLFVFLAQLTCRYFRTKAYFEVDIDIGSSMVAYNTVSLAIGYAKSLVVDIGFCVQVWGVVVAAISSFLRRSCCCCARLTPINLLDENQADWDPFLAFAQWELRNDYIIGGMSSVRMCRGACSRLGHANFPVEVVSLS